MSNHKDILLELIVENNLKVIAEIGIYRSDLCRFLLLNLDNIDEYWAIDPWDIRYVQKGMDSTWTMDEWNHLYYKAAKLMAYFPQLKVIRMSSVSASKLFPKQYFDFIYIDGNHLYENVLADLGSWYPKLKKGGIIAGHDYMENVRRIKSGYSQVKPAVDDFFGRENIILKKEDVGENVWIYHKV